MMNLGLGDQSQAGSMFDSILQLLVPAYGAIRLAQGAFDKDKRAGTIWDPFNNEIVNKGKGLLGMGSDNDPWGQPGAYNGGSGGFTQPGDLRSPGLFGTGLFADVGQANSVNDNYSVWGKDNDGSYTYGSDVDMGPSTDDLDDDDEASGNAGEW
jgi:hypothetical protein